MVKLRKIQASTLIESIVAMVIISITMGMAFLIMSNISAKNNPQLKFKAYIEAQQAINKTLTTGIIKDDAWQKGGMYAEVRFLAYHDYENLRMMEVRVLNNAGRTLVLRKELIRVP
jgi:uncharacterized protein YxeA